MITRMGLFTLSLALLLSTRVNAQVTPAEKAAAEALFDRGVTALREGKLEEACARLEQSNQIERGIGTMLYLAECYEKSGRTASAWALFREAASEAQASGQVERAQAGRQRAERLEPSLARLVIEVPQEHRVPKLEVYRNGVAVLQGAWGIGLPVDPGEHRVEARAPGFEPSVQTVTVEKGPGVARMEIGKLTPAVAAVSTPEVEATVGSAPPSGGTMPAAPMAPPPPPGGLTKLQIAGIIGGAAGIVILGVGVGMGVKAKNKRDDAGCGDEWCPTPTALDTWNDARTVGRVSTAGWIVGGALLTGGLLTYFLAPKPERPTVSFSANTQMAMLRVGGSW